MQFMASWYLTLTIVICTIAQDWRSEVHRTPNLLAYISVRQRSFINSEKGPSLAYFSVWPLPPLQHWHATHSPDCDTPPPPTK